METSDAIDRLRAESGSLRQAGVRSLYLFGSVARGTAGAGSDVDVFVDDDEQLDLFTLVGLQHHLSDILGRPVDIGTRNGLHPKLRERIEGEAIRVF